jgi:carbamoyl-phosphate synthase large subunit
MRIFAIADAFANGFTVDQIHDITKIDKWFIYRLKYIFDLGEKAKKFNNVQEITDDMMRELKRAGFSDFQIAKIVYKHTAVDITADMLKVREHRKALGITPFVKQIDTLAAEYPAQTNYLYITYHGTEHDIDFYDDKQSVIVLGSGAYRIGSSVEFDWCGVNAINTIRKRGFRAIMINYNPETVSTDYDTCDRLILTNFHTSASSTSTTSNSLTAWLLAPACRFPTTSRCVFTKPMSPSSAHRRSTSTRRKTATNFPNSATV